MTWILIFYLSSGFGNTATGGPAVIEGFTSEAKCNAAIQVINKTPKFDFGYCKGIEK